MLIVCKLLQFVDCETGNNSQFDLAIITLLYCIYTLKLFKMFNSLQLYYVSQKTVMQAKQNVNVPYMHAQNELFTLYCTYSVYKYNITNILHLTIPLIKITT